AILLPGALCFGGLAWGARRRPWLQRLSLFTLLALVTMMGTTACNPRYDYFHHGPPINPATPAGTYTVIVTAQSSNGVTAITNSTTMALTVQESGLHEPLAFPSCGTLRVGRAHAGNGAA